ncbi:CAI-1 autoinducer sensor kinase/phosphatase CqsS [Paraliobacillus sp. PM-2]|uniref:sensor histidine kinase n=1 Tax=Paraliobacillus sp. PM-2 TaxID=1462524 RepID=UPI00061BA4E3|nr:HAMP domain-containing sensor histidine kinase [Paraliobacillus sp. PM-2]CQR47416.1 CAI-1 autoinducer sensor kinase/phosphatase CqsS [Paraliobacillus sp. PM-2]
MLIILMIFLIFSSITLLIMKRNKETFYLFGLCVSLATMLTGILIYIAKKGGISRDLQNFFFFTHEIKTNIQFFFITLDNLGMIVAIGRYLFPLFLLLLAIHYSRIKYIRKSRFIKKLLFIMPIISLILYYPAVFRFITSESLIMQQILVTSMMVWIVIYIIISFILLAIEFKATKIKFLQKRFISVIAFVCSLSLLYLLYFGQDPAQVYQFYYAERTWGNGIYYMNAVLSIPAYITIVLFNIVFAIIGFTSLGRYTFEILESNREEITIQRKFEAISSGASMFVHGIKNQLLANKVILNRINRIYDSESVNMQQIKEYHDTLSKQNENILKRMDTLYNSIKTNVVRLSPVKIKDVINMSLDAFHHKFPDKTIELAIKKDITVFADKTHLSEAIYNLLINAQEAINENTLDENKQGELKVSCYEVSSYSIVEVKDNGVGISKSEIKKIAEPFYSNKNSNYNWGMGLQYVRMVAKKHFGSLRYESEKGKGSTFYILLPK